MTLDQLAELRGVNGEDLSVTAVAASGVNDGAAALLLLNEKAAKAQGLTPKSARPRHGRGGRRASHHGDRPNAAARKILARDGLRFDQMDVVELNEAFAAQSLAVMRGLGLEDDDPRVNPNGGANVVDRPLGMSGARRDGDASTSSPERPLRALRHARRRRPRSRHRHRANLNSRRRLRRADASRGETPQAAGMTVSHVRRGACGPCRSVIEGM